MAQAEEILLDEGVVIPLYHSVSMNVINLKEDEKITDKKLNDIVRKLYNTGYFSDVKLSEKNNILEITVAENPTVNAVSFEGYSDLKLDDIKKDVKTRHFLILKI